MRSSRPAVLALMAAFSAVACGSASSPGDGGTSPPSGDDAEAGATFDAGDASALDSTAWNLGEGGGLPCGQPAAAYCAVHQCTESAVEASLCAHSRAWSFDCGGLHGVTDGVPDASTSYYFDPSTGALVAVVSSGAVSFGGAETCLAGPSAFVEPICRVVVMVPVCPDAAAVANGDASTADH